MKLALGLLAASIAAIVATWWWLGRPIAMPVVADDKLQCISYAPFRADQSPLVAGTHVAAAQIEEDLTRLRQLTGCIRTYSIEHGVDQVPAIAQRLGMKVLQGVWLGRDRQRNRLEIDTAVGLAKSYPDVVIGIVVGNEVLLRGELAADDIAAALREVKAATAMPVTYADVWEFWLRNRDLATAVDFVTIHILPYWEDFPIPADIAAAHVDEIRSRVAAALPGKEILVGEVGWPSAGRMREGALPSPSNQAHVLEEVMARARAKNYRVILIEAFDQPWKRQLEGTVGGFWGLFGSTIREAKFTWGEPVSDHPMWAWQLAAGIVLSAIIFVSVAAIRRRVLGAPLLHKLPMPILAGIVVNGVAGGVMAPWAVENAVIESLGPGGWLRAAAFVAVACVAPIAVSLTLARDGMIPTFTRVLGPPAQRTCVIVALASGVVLVALTALALQTALGLVFDPRYRDFTFAPLTAAVVPFAVASAVGARGTAPPGVAETVAAATLAGAAVYILFNETFANWQAVWFAGLLVLLAVTLVRLRDAQST